VTLRRSAASHDLASIRGTLEATLSADWPEGPSMRQALSLLQRANAMAALAAQAKRTT